MKPARISLRPSWAVKRTPSSKGPTETEIVYAIVRPLTAMTKHKISPFQQIQQFGYAMKSKLFFSFLAIVATAFAPQAHGQYYSNMAELNGVGAGWIGNAGFVNFGQTFSIKKELQINSWTFYPLNGNNGNVKLFISSWTTQQNAGALIYESAPISYAGPYYGELKFTSINTLLPAGSYISYLSVSEVPGASSSIAIQTTPFDGGLHGSFRFNVNFNPHSPNTQSNVWYYSQGQTSLGYTATFSSSVTSIDESMPIALAISGLAVLGFARPKIRGRKQIQTK